MAKQKIAAIEYIRGISMLGVIGIHTGSQYLSNPSANMHLIALFEVFTRFSVPIFFFISAFGLFLNHDFNKAFSYRDFMKRRINTVLKPYLFWSFIYIIHYTLLYSDPSFFYPLSLLKTLFFGLASYQLYFLVILLWFYALMPVWIAIINRMTLSKMAALLVMQIAFDYYSSFILSAQSSSLIINQLITYRLNYIVLHYLFIFILGGWCAVNYEKFNLFLKKYYIAITAFFYISMAALLYYYYYLIYQQQYSLESAINTAHQLSPCGIIYTLGASLFFFAYFTYGSIAPRMHTLLSYLGRHSYFAYLFHPFVIFYLAKLIAASGHLMTAPITMIYYILVAAISVVTGSCCRKLGTTYSIINKLTIGVYPRKK